MGDNDNTITLSQMFAEMHECIRELKEEYRGVNAKLVDLERQVAELRGDIQRLREAEDERKRSRREVWGVAMRAAVTAAAAGAIGWMAMGFKQAVGQ